MSERAVSKRIMAAIENSSLNEVTVILNGRPELRAGKLVYAALDTGAPGRDPELIFYTRQSAAGTVTQKTRVDLPNFYEYLVYALLSNELYGVKVPGEASLSCCTISVCNEMRCLLLESHLYANTRKLVGENYNSVVTTFKFGRDYLSEEDCRKLREAFKNNSYADYDALFFESRSRKFLNKLKYRSKDFYGIQSSFIPVFLNYTKVYNPLLSNPLVLKTDLYKKAARKGRYEERGSLSCYYLTHREICEALHMDRFMRFTSSFLYKVFVGLLFPDNLYFPSEGRNVIVRPDNDEDLIIVRRPVFSEPEFVSVVAKYQNLLKQEDITDTARSDAQRALRELGTYEKQSSLFYLCKTNASVLSNVGCTYIDDDTKKTAAAYYEYVKAASL